MVFRARRRTRLDLAFIAGIRTVLSNKFGFGRVPALGLVENPATSQATYRIFDYRAIVPDPENNPLSSNYFPVVAYNYNGSLGTTWDGWKP